MEIDSSYLFLSFLYGAFGLFLFMFGKKSGRFAHLFAGLALMIFPYFITNLIAMTLICLTLTVAPFFVPE